ncbi:MAG: DNA-directed RNA polymerase subunit omega [Intestinibacillus sp.]
MLKPSMNELMKRVGNRYLLVNLVAQRARDLSEQAEESGDPLDDKAVKLALEEIASGRVVYRPGPAKETVVRPLPKIDLGGTLDLDFSDEEEDELVESDDFDEEQGEDEE